jgi:hypothetical protein
MMDGAFNNAQWQRRSGSPLVGVWRDTRAGHATVSARFPAPREKFPDAVDRMIGNASEYVAQIGLGIDAEHFARLQDREHRCSPVAAGIGAQEDEVFSSMDIFP